MIRDNLIEDFERLKQNSNIKIFKSSYFLPELSEGVLERFLQFFRLKFIESQATSEPLVSHWLRPPNLEHQTPMPELFG